MPLAEHTRTKHIHSQLRDSTSTIDTGPCFACAMRSPADKLSLRNTQPEWPSPQSQSLSRSYGSILPTSLTYVILLARGFSPWRPAADMGTNLHEIYTPLSQLIISRANASASDGTRPVPLLVVAHPISGQTDSRVFTLHASNHLTRKDNSLRNLR